jgi:uncharacterized membrane protein YqiK
MTQSDPGAFERAKTLAEGRRQAAMAEAHQAYDAAVKAADREYFALMIAACELYGINPSVYQQGLRSLG